jgi:hypothetical protein
VAHAEQLPQLLLEFLDTGARVRQPATIHYFFDSLQETLFVADIRPANVQLFLKARLASENSEIPDAFFCRHVVIFAVVDLLAYGAR